MLRGVLLTALAISGCAPRADGGGDVRPEKPAGLSSWIDGNEADATPALGGPGLVLMGGGADVEAAFAWARDGAPGGDVVVLRTSGSDGYNLFLLEDVGGFDSVETLLVDDRALADSPYVAWAISHAELVFLAGGDQWTYVESWKDTAVETELEAAWERGAYVGGTSAGLAILGEISFTAENGTVLSSEALADPYRSEMTLERDFLAFPPLASVISDSHFADRDRMGRLVAFLARAVEDGWTTRAVGVGVDEATALLVEADGSATVAGSGAAHVVVADHAPETCDPGAPLVFTNLTLRHVRAGDTAQLPDGSASTAPIALSASNGTLVPAQPY